MKKTLFVMFMLVVVSFSLAACAPPISREVADKYFRATFPKAELYNVGYTPYASSYAYTACDSGHLMKYYVMGSGTPTTDKRMLWEKDVVCGDEARMIVVLHEALDRKNDPAYERNAERVISAWNAYRQEAEKFWDVKLPMDSRGQ